MYFCDGLKERVGKGEKMAASGVLFVGGRDVSNDLVNQYKQRSKDWAKKSSFNVDTSKLPKGSAEKLGAELLKWAADKDNYTALGGILQSIGNLFTGQGLQASPTNREEFRDVLTSYYKSKGVALQQGQFNVMDGKDEEKELFFVGKFQDFLNSQGKDKPQEKNGLLSGSFLAGTLFEGREIVFYVLLLIFILWLINRS